MEKLISSNNLYFNQNSYFTSEWDLFIAKKVDQKNLKDLYGKYGYKTEKINYHRNSVNGEIRKGGQKYFFKCGLKDQMVSELNGYNRIKKSYPVPRFIEKISDKKHTILIFSFEVDNKEILWDYINSHTYDISRNTIQKLEPLFKIYKKNLAKQVKKKEFPSNVLFRKRITQRIIPWYINNNKLKNLFNYKLKINGRSYKNSTTDLINNCIEYFKRKKELTCFLSQGDPTERNMSLKPIFFDYQTSGYNPVIADFAVFFWNLYLSGGYLSPKYLSEFYFGYKDVMKNTEKNKPEISYKVYHERKRISIKIKYSPPPLRKLILKKYIQLFGQKSLAKEFNEDLKYYLLLRIFGNLNVSKMSEDDMVLNLAYAQIFFQKEEDLIKHLSLLLEGVKKCQQ